VVRAVLSFRVLLAAGLVTVYLLTITNRFNDPDLWFHLKLGEVVWNTHSIPTTELFSHTAFGYPWTAHEWLGQLSIYTAYHIAGLPGLMAWLATCGSLLFALVYILCYQYSRNALPAFLGGMFAWFFGSVGFAIRPHLLGYTFLVVELLVIELAGRRRKWLWLLPLLFAVWVNVHGSYVFGIGLLAAFWVSGLWDGSWKWCGFKQWDGLSPVFIGVILGLCCAALCLNPVGPRLLLYPFNVAFRQSTSLAAIYEWQPPALDDLRTLGMLAAVMAVVAAVLLKRIGLRLRDLLFVGMATAMAGRHVRMLFVFGIVMSPLLARLSASLLREDGKREFPIANAILMCALGITILSFYPGAAELEAQVQQNTPSQAVAFVRQSNLSGAMLNDYAFGGYLIWALPDHKVFVDGRGDVFDWTGVLKEFGRWATLAEDPHLLLDKYHIGFCVLSRKSPLTHVLPYLPGWQAAYSDDVASVFVRQQPVRSD
jgi:hypothetical protein